jgi:creatinine amidohydrolase/Fe(II)-dependent formamide hydrolase-like protein
MLAWAYVDYQLVQDQYEPAGDHAAGWETSHLLALYPHTVDLNALPAKGEDLIGVRGAEARPPQDATAAFGRETLEAAAEVMVQEVTHRLRHRSMYVGRGNSLREGLWR